MIARLAELLLLLAPAFAANMAPPVVTRFWKGWNPPLCAPLLGSHKTVLGTAGGLAAATLLALVQGTGAAFGLALGVGALGGDALKSILKRRRGLPPGVPWVPADQLDFALGALAAAAFWVDLGMLDIALVLAACFAGHIAVNHAAFALGIRNARW